MDLPFLVALEAAEGRAADLVGAKAAGLGTLAHAGFPVPPGLCVTTAAYRAALRPVGAELAAALATPSLDDPIVAGDVARRCGELLARLEMPHGLAEGLSERLPELRAPAGAGSAVASFAVRSSATAEDLAGVSFAGQYETFLGLLDADSVHEAILECWRSFFSANALVARAGAGRLGSDEAMAVLVQPLIDAECAGVAYSVDPVRARRDLMVVEATWGLGVGTVDGTVQNDVARVYRPTMRVDEHLVAEKRERIAPAADGGVERRTVDEERRRAACLGDGWLLRIAQFAAAAEALAGSPQDIEWAIAGGRVWLLQSRALTALPPELATVEPFPVTWPTPGDARRPWQLSDTSRTEVPLTLDHDLADTFNLAVDDAIRFVGKTFFSSSRAVVLNGRRYLTPVPGPHRPGDVRVRERAMSDLSRRLLQEQGQTAWDHWGPEVITATRRLAEKDLAALDGEALAEHVEDALAVFRRHWMIHWLLWFPPIDEFREAHRALTGAAERPEPVTLAPLLDGEDTPLTRLIDGLYELGTLARADPVLRAVVREAAPDALGRLGGLPAARDFLQRLERFLDDHGDRTGTGYGSAVLIRTPTWREAPERVLALLARYLDDEVEAPAAARARARARRDAEIEALCAGKDEEKVAEFRRQLALARKDAVVLEEHNHYIDQLSTAQLRAAVMAAGAFLTRRGALPEAERVYWLSFDEIVTELRRPEAEAATPEACQRVRDLLRERVAVHARQSTLTPPPVLGVPAAELPPRGPLRDDVTAQAPQGPATVGGTGASAGRHRGRARVVTDVTVVPTVERGDVLVAVNAGPAWTPIFPILGALVLDHGSVTQHSGATAREYGIPCVVGTRNATRRIPDGAWVSVDGAAGTVEIEFAAEAAAGAAVELPRSA